MIRWRPRLPLVGGMACIQIEWVNPKPKPFLRRKNRCRLGGSACLPLVVPEPSRNSLEGGDSTPVASQRAINASGTQRAIGASGTQRAIDASGTRRAIGASGTRRAIDASGTLRAIGASGTQRAIDASSTQRAIDASGSTSGDLPSNPIRKEPRQTGHFTLVLQAHPSMRIC
jgi:hypothetical protein